MTDDADTDLGRLRRFALVAFPPRTSRWSDLVNLRCPELLGVFEKAYGDKDRGGSVHIDRLLSTEPWVFTAENKRGRIVGCSYVHRSGKRGATAVLPAFRGIGIGRGLISFSLAYEPDQWAEVGSEDTGQQQRYGSAGFIVSNEWGRIVRLIGPLLSPLVVRHEVGPQGIVYSRETFTPPRTIKTFVLMIHGEPIDRIANNGKVYVVD